MTTTTNNRKKTKSLTQMNAAVRTAVIFPTKTKAQQDQALAVAQIGGETKTINGTRLVLDGEFANALDGLSTPQEREMKMEQLVFSITTTKSAPAITFRSEDGLVIDGYKTINALDRIEQANPEIRTEIKVELSPVSCADRSEAMELRFQVQDAAREWNGERAIITILKDATLRKRIESGCLERRKNGKAIKDGVKGTKWELLGAKARVDKSIAYKLAAILDSAKATEYVADICRAKGDRAKRTVNACFKEVKNKEKRDATQAAYGKPLPPIEGNNPVDCIINKSAADGLQMIPRNSVGLAITSVVYPHPQLYKSFGLNWDKSGKYKGWLKWMKADLKEMLETLNPGAYGCINVADVSVAKEDRVGADEEYPRRDCLGDMRRIIKSLGAIYCDTFIWYKQNADGNYPRIGSEDRREINTAYEYIIVFRKRGERTNKTGEATTDPDQIKWLLGGVWDFFPQSGNSSPCKYPFPEELPYRLIQLYSATGDIVLDWNCGSGTTCVVAKKLNRRFIGIEIDKETAEYAHNRILAVKAGDAVVRAKSVIHAMAQAAARRILNCPDCRDKAWELPHYTKDKRQTCDSCGRELEVFSGHNDKIHIAESD